MFVFPALLVSLFLSVCAAPVYAADEGEGSAMSSEERTALSQRAGRLLSISARELASTRWHPSLFLTCQRSGRAQRDGDG
ncbi:MAG: hypothetical protein LBT65_06720 [Synergistaceae bacterium]|nr:hypothetical protein [Synergistaceae bacterium]